jgi:hypothetical protein
MDPISAHTLAAAAGVENTVKAVTSSSSPPAGSPEPSSRLIGEGGGGSGTCGM